MSKFTPERQEELKRRAAEKKRNLWISILSVPLLIINFVCVGSFSDAVASWGMFFLLSGIGTCVIASFLYPLAKTTTFSMIETLRNTLAGSLMIYLVFLSFIPFTVNSWGTKTKVRTVTEFVTLENAIRYDGKAVGEITYIYEFVYQNCAYEMEVSTLYEEQLPIEVTQGLLGWEHMVGIVEN